MTFLQTLLYYPITMNKQLVLAIGFLVLSLVTAKSVQADNYDNRDDGRQIVVDKEIKATSQENWHENLSSNTITFASENYLEFKIKIKNTGDKELKNIKVIDNLPHEVKPIEHPGDYNQDNHNITWHIDQLDKGEENEFYLKVQIKHDNNLEQGRLVCPRNRAEARSETNEYDSDSASFCIDTRILGAETLPEAGNGTLIATLIAGSIIGLGFFARKIGRGELLN